MTQPVQGLHHVTVMASDPQRNIDFYSVLLGQRLVKVTVNFDDPGTYHLYYGDEVGSPGTVMTHFPWPHAERGRRGNGEAVGTAYSVGRASLDFWRERLAHLNAQQTERFGQPVLTVEDPDGTWVDLVADDGLNVPQPWADAPVPAEHALRGFHSVTLWVESADSVRDLLVGQLGFTEVGREPDPHGLRVRFQGAGAGVGLYVDAVERPGQPKGQFGAGSIHHVALRTVDDAEQAEYLTQLRAAGYPATPVQDRQYFHSIYFREPGGVLFEIATDAPGFPDDEPVAELGQHLRLPRWFEGHREAIERRLPRIVNRESGSVLGGGQTGEGQPVTFRDPDLRQSGRAPHHTRVALVLVHGRGGTAADILQLSEQWNMSVYAVLAPQASGNSWYPQSFLAPLEQNQPQLDQALERLDTLLSDLERAGIPPAHVMLGGFSQGACLVSEYVARHPQRYGGVFVYSGALLTLDHHGDLQGTPVFMGNSDHDPHIPDERFQASAEVFRSLGARMDARIYPGLGHTIHQDELDAVGRLMQRLSLESV
ncbi:VOC family protein [Deinococcus sonorensis]|uniref:VOC family protein n=2 Tax=Deinococcus sonorensis TaxID=309891 RepID=A0AAU7U9L9_9DEIO